MSKLSKKFVFQM